MFSYTSSEYLVALGCILLVLQLQQFRARVKQQTNAPHRNRLFILLHTRHETVKSDCTVSCIVRAPDIRTARRLAQEEGKAETWGADFHTRVPFWTDPKQTSCRPLHEQGKPGLVLSDVYNG